MLKTRVIPTLLWKNHGLVKGVGFDSWRRVGTVLPSVKVYNLREVDEIAVLDITATLEEREPDYESIAEFSRESFVPMAVGGGIRNVEQIRKLLLVGADKVIINSAAYADPEFIRRAADRFGSQCVIASIDYRTGADGTARCMSACGSAETGREPVEWAKQLECLGAGEILLTSVERDGTMGGYDTAMVRKVSEAVGIPVIASGGAGSYEDAWRVIEEGGASAIAAASIFHFTELTPLGIKAHLAEKGIPVRLS